MGWFLVGVKRAFEHVKKKRRMNIQERIAGAALACFGLIFMVTLQ
jgi:hypothetical protein